MVSQNPTRSAYAFVNPGEPPRMVDQSPAGSGWTTRLLIVESVKIPDWTSRSRNSVRCSSGGRAASGGGVGVPAAGGTVGGPALPGVAVGAGPVGDGVPLAGTEATGVAAGVAGVVPGGVEDGAGLPTDDDGEVGGAVVIQVVVPTAGLRQLPIVGPDVAAAPPVASAEPDGRTAAASLGLAVPGDAPGTWLPRATSSKKMPSNTTTTAATIPITQTAGCPVQRVPDMPRNLLVGSMWRRYRQRTCHIAHEMGSRGPVLWHERGDSGHANLPVGGHAPPG